MLLTLLNVASSISSKVNIEAVLDKLISWGIETGKNIIGAILIYVIGRFLIKQIGKLLTKFLERRKLEVSVKTFLKSLLSITLNLILAFAVIARLGVETTSFAAILASAGVAIGMALSGNLSNFAGGLIILVFKPFKVGDFIDGPGASGTVKEIQIFHTILATVDNKMFISTSTKRFMKHSIKKVSDSHSHNLQFIRPKIKKTYYSSLSPGLCIYYIFLGCFFNS